MSLGKMTSFIDIGIFKNVKDEELQRIADNVRLVGADSDAAELIKLILALVNGVRIIPIVLG